MWKLALAFVGLIAGGPAQAQNLANFPDLKGTWTGTSESIEIGRAHV